MAGRGDIKAGGAFVRLFLKDEMTRALVRSFRNAGQSVRKFGAGIQRIGAPIAAAGAAITTGLVAAVKHFAAVGDQLDKMSKRTGIAASALAGFGFAAEQSGTNLGAVEKGIRRMQKNIRDLELGLSTSVDAFASLGISMDEIQGKSPEDQFQLIAERLTAIEDPSMRAAVAQEVFGRAGAALIPMLGNLKALREEARELGIIPSDEEVANAAKVTDAINRVKRAIGAAFFNVGSSLADSVLVGLESVKKITVAIGKWVGENAGLIKVVAAIGLGLLAAGAAIIAFGTAIIGVGFAISAMGSILGVIGAAVSFLLSPIGLVAAALAAGVFVWLKYTDSGKAAIKSLSTFLGDLLAISKQTFGGIIDAIKARDFKLAGQIAFAGLRLAVAEGLLAIQSIVGDTMTSIVGKLASGDFSGAWADTLSQLALLWFAWSEGVINVITGVASKITEIWRGATTYIAKQILELGKMPAFAKAFESFTGVNLIEEQGRGEDLKEQQRKRVTKRITENTATRETLLGERQTAETEKQPLEQQRDTIAAEISALADGNDDLLVQIERRQKLEQQLFNPSGQEASGPEASRRLIEEIEAIDAAIASAGDTGDLQEKVSARLQVEGEIVDADEILSGITSELERIEGELKSDAELGIELSVPYDIVAEAQDLAGEDIANQADAINATLDKINRRAAMNTEAAAKSAVAATDDGMGAIREAARLAREDLDSLSKEAKEKRVAADKEKEEKEKDDEAEPITLAAPAFSKPSSAATVKDLTTASAASAVAAGFGAGGPQRDVASAINSLRRVAIAQKLEQEKQLAATKEVNDAILKLNFALTFR